MTSDRELAVATGESKRGAQLVPARLLVSRLVQ